MNKGSQIDDAMRESLGRLCADIVRMEASEVAALEKGLAPSLVEALELLRLENGKIIVIGIGKSGHIGRKVAATLSSTGSPAFFLHATEACHGDAGFICEGDCVLAISQSGESEEFAALFPLIHDLGVPVVAITGGAKSALARSSDVVLLNQVEREACPHNLAPTTSTTTALVIGDVLAMCLLQLNGFTPEDFARSHPAGTLGRRLLLRVRDTMVTGDALPCVLPETPLSEAIVEISRKNLGITAVVAADGRILGVFTDGDLRRSLQDKVDIHNTAIEGLMTRKFHTIGAEAPAVEALEAMENGKITSLLVPDGDGRLIGVVTMHTLIQKRLL